MPSLGTMHGTRKLADTKAKRLWQHARDRDRLPAGFRESMSLGSRHASLVSLRDDLAYARHDHFLIWSKNGTQGQVLPKRGGTGQLSKVSYGARSVHNFGGHGRPDRGLPEHRAVDLQRLRLVNCFYR
jgi:hypothetical protein